MTNPFNALVLRAPLKTKHFWKNQELKALIFRYEFPIFWSF
jgi:hypothetical protein